VVVRTFDCTGGGSRARPTRVAQPLKPKCEPQFVGCPRRFQPGARRESNGCGGCWVMTWQKSSVARCMVHPPQPPSPTWRTFLWNGTLQSSVKSSQLRSVKWSASRTLLVTYTIAMPELSDVPPQLPHPKRPYLSSAHVANTAVNRCCFLVLFCRKS